MVFVADEGSRFNSPIGLLWKYLFRSEAHDASPTTTRRPTLEKISDVTPLYGSERLLRGRWAPDRLRLSMFPPIPIVTEWLEGVLAGSKFVYVCAPEGPRTRINVHGEFTSTTLSPKEVEEAAREFLDTEFRDDAPAVRELVVRSR